MTEQNQAVARTTTEFDQNRVEMIRYANGAVAFKDGDQYGNWIYFYPEQIAVVTAFINKT